LLDDRLCQDQPWYVVAVEPQSEQRVASRSGDLDIEAYVPTGKALVARRRRKLRILEMVDRPAMPGYVFVRGGRFAQFGREMDAGDAVPHCLGFLKGDEGPEALPASAVAEMQQRQQRGDYDVATQTGRYYAPRWMRAGAAARIVAGPLKGLSGEIWRLTRRLGNPRLSGVGGRGAMVAIWVRIMGRPTLAELPVDHVVRAR
jgi:transcription antitermination factor NusG